MKRLLNCRRRRSLKRLSTLQRIGLLDSDAWHVSGTRRWAEMLGLTSQQMLKRPATRAVYTPKAMNIG